MLITIRLSEILILMKVTVQKESGCSVLLTFIQQVQKSSYNLKTN